MRAANSDGVWNEDGASVRVTVRPPWWRTTWAYVCYGLFALIGIGAIDRVQRRRLLQKERERAHQVLQEAHTELRETHAQLQAAQAELKSLDRAKTRFFANVSHEFRTPLTLIVGPLEDMLEGDYGALDPEAEELVSLAVENSQRLLLLVNQLLDIARLEAGRLTLHAKPVDVAAFIEGITQRFMSMAAHKHIDFEVTVPEETVVAYFDVDQMEKVMGNLLGNAFKFTPQGQHIAVRLFPDGEAGEEGWLAIVVQDTGPGIDPTHLPHLFERFYQADDSSTRQQSGTGIGLALVHELVTLHHGTIEVASTPGEGATFTIRLPVGTAYYSGEELQSAPPSTFAQRPRPLAEASLIGEVVLSDEPVQERGDVAVVANAAPGEDATTVLVVDDNPQVRAYVQRHLEKQYRVVEAANGQEALAVAVEVIPDLIVSDVMMPEMDGFALCHAIKTHPELDFIPVILLTAKASMDSKLSGLETGADAYMTKPFHVRELEVRIENLIALRRQLRSRYAQEAAPFAFPTTAPVSSADEAFLEEVHAVITTHLADEGFGVQELAAALGQSRASLYRRFKGLIDQSPMDLIWQMRLAEAAHRLQARAGTISEVAYSVGFKSVSHFSKRFREAYDKTPMAFVAELDPTA